MTQNTALITGASSGLGSELARLHAAAGDNLVLVARSRNKMETLSEELKAKFGTKVYIITKDLSLPTSAEEVYDEVKSQGIEVEYLINNAVLEGKATLPSARWKTT